MLEESLPPSPAPAYTPVPGYSDDIAWLLDIAPCLLIVAGIIGGLIWLIARSARLPAAAPGACWKCSDRGFYTRRINTHLPGGGSHRTDYCTCTAGQTARRNRVIERG